MIVSRRGCRWANCRGSTEEMKVSCGKKRLGGGIEKIRTPTSVNVEVDEPGSKITTVRIDSIMHVWGGALADDLYHFVGDLQPSSIGDSIGQNQSRVMDTSHRFASAWGLTSRLSSLLSRSDLGNQQLALGQSSRSFRLRGLSRSSTVMNRS